LKQISKRRQVHSQNIMACIWDFDKTLIPGYMQTPLFEHFGINEHLFWQEVNQLPKLYKERGIRVSSETIYLNHLLSYIKNGPLRGLTNQKLQELGKELKFNPGLPNFLSELKAIPSEEEFEIHDFKLEHYVISTGLAQIIRGSKINIYLEDVFACEFIESPLPPNYLSQKEFSLPIEPEISQVGMTVDNTIKTRFIFEINKGCNKNSSIDVNSAIEDEDRRIPIDQMIYVADGPSDVPVFAVVKQMGGKAYAVYDQKNEVEFAQTCELVESSRVHNNGPADYSPGSTTCLWMKQKVRDTLRAMIKKRTDNLDRNTKSAPKHLPMVTPIDRDDYSKQETFWK